MARRRTATTQILAQVPAARARDARERQAGRRATSACYDAARGRMVLELSNGFLFGFPIAAIPSLANATQQELEEVSVSPGGSGLRWDALDVDLSVPGVLLSSIGRAEKLTELARLAGQAKSPAKAAASRTNGAKGGRPRKRVRR